MFEVLFAVLGVVAAASPAPGVASEAIRGRGIVGDKILYLLAEVHGCSAEPSVPEAQIFVSRDEGRSWEKSGPALEGSEFLYAADDGGTLWAAGLHTAEGPALDPFFLVPTPRVGQVGWTVRSIREGPAELMGVAHAGLEDLLAWVRPTDAQGNRARGGTLLYRSRDGGRTWTAEKGGGHAAPRKLPRITTRSGRWRIVDRRDGGFDVQRLDGMAWVVVKEFPWTVCPAR